WFNNKTTLLRLCNRGRRQIFAGRLFHAQRRCTKHQFILHDADFHPARPHEADKGFDNHAPRKTGPCCKIGGHSWLPRHRVKKQMLDHTPSPALLNMEAPHPAQDGKDNVNCCHGFLPFSSDQGRTQASLADWARSKESMNLPRKPTSWSRIVAET